ncbi:MAG: DUF72 domain-containing protein [Alphaproteobacteria bacterium HGW-Alphaproteobacteria-18]|nr:MAG: DUF72 domain-containing protein [Alphaproteobacteria bacterium HGW-Alphaproteobacteria-18]
MSHPIRIGIGGWSYEPWRETFYPAEVKKAGELAFASAQVTAIEINSTFYRNQTEAVFAKWAGETPENFRFTVKAQRVTTVRKTVEDMKTSVDWFIGGGVTALGDKLGAINWQFPETRKYDADYFGAFCSFLPPEHKGVRLRHAIEVRNETFRNEAFTDLMRQHGCAVVFADDPDWPMPDLETADFAYARLQQSRADLETGYEAGELDAWGKTLTGWAKGREVFAFFISGAKERNPAAAKALIGRVGRP